MNAFESLLSLNVNDHTEKKTVGGSALTYLSWPWAWSETKKRYPDAHYEIYKDANGLPYVCDPLTGYMVYTSVTIDGVTHEMWLPVMDGNNKAMKTAPYTIKTKYREIEVAAATMFDINKTIMRCLVKNLAMFGLGLYIFAGEDLPEAEDEPEQAEASKATAKKAEKKPAQKAENKPEEKKPVQKKENTGALIICEKCHKPLIPVTGNNGALIAIDRIKDVSIKRFNKVYCAACQAEMKKA